MKYGCIILLIFCSIAWLKISKLESNLKLEKSEHQITEIALIDAVNKGQGWKAAYETMSKGAEANAVATKACLEREKTALEATQARELILYLDKPRNRTETEKEQVVSDETRKSAASRLNRNF